MRVILDDVCNVILFSHWDIELEDDIYFKSRINVLFCLPGVHLVKLNALLIIE